MKLLLYVSLLLKTLYYGNTCGAKEFKDVDYYRLPPLFHLDDYQRCLSQPGGLYCLGTFHIQPAVVPHPDYEFIKIQPHNCSTRLVRERTMQAPAGQRFADRSRHSSLQFERCAAQWGRARGLTTSLHTLRYCRSHQDTLIKEPTTPQQRTFIEVVYVILLFNIIGTAYDVMTDDDTKKIKLLTAWSIPANWRRLISACDNPRTAPLNILQGFKAILMFLTLLVHTGATPYRFFTGNPEFLEEVTNRLDGKLVATGSSLVHIFITISALLTTHDLLVKSEQKPLSFNMLPSCILKRFFRLAPVNLLVVGYAATWWPYARQGPLVAPVIGEESRQCRDKYWAQALFINNIVAPGDNCLTPTWFLAAAFQLHILICGLTLAEGWLKRNALTVYPALVVAASIVNGLLVYIFDYKSLIYISSPENVKTMFHGERSFSYFYKSTWGAIPACLVGMFLAHLHYRLHKKIYKTDNHKWLVFCQYIFMPLTFLWILAGTYVRGYRSPLIIAVYGAFHCTILATIMAAGFFAFMNKDGALRRFFAWSGWNVVARLSLPVMLLHWCVNMSIAARPYAYHTSIFDMAVDWLATGCITYAIAVPIAVLVEIPMQKFLSSLIL